MAHFDPETGRLCLHVVYDGAPFSGKTTSLWTLAHAFGRQVETPEERQGRTVYFDWLDYDGGLYRDEPIRCRIIAVPGQSERLAYRLKILKAADAVVFVADTTAAGFASTREHFADLCERLTGRDREIPILVQLNKRDAADAVDLDQAEASFVPGAVRSLVSVATDGEGVREIFTLAVGEAIRALRQEHVSGLTLQPIPSADEPDLANPASLFDQLTLRLRRERALRSGDAQ